MEKIREYTGADYIYMQLRLENGEVHEISCYLRATGTKYWTTGDDSPDKRAQIIDAFNALY